MLAKRGAFLPYGIALTSDGTERMLAADPGLGDHPGAPAILELLRESVARDRQELRGYAIVMDALVDGADAIRVDLEHRDGIGLTVSLPFTIKGRLVMKPEHGQLRASRGERRVWPATS